MNPIPEAAKAYVALVGAIATALLGVFTGDTGVGQVLTVVAVVATAIVTFRVPNRPRHDPGVPPPRHRGDLGAGELDFITRVLVVVLLLLGVLWFALEIVGRT